MQALHEDGVQSRTTIDDDDGFVPSAQDLAPERSDLVRDRDRHRLREVRERDDDRAGRQPWPRRLWRKPAAPPKDHTL